MDDKEKQAFENLTEEQKQQVAARADFMMMVKASCLQAMAEYFAAVAQQQQTDALAQQRKSVIDTSFIK
jgi:hypothetical protein